MVVKGSRLPALLILVGTFAFSGASCPRNWMNPMGPSSAQLPRVLPPNPSLEQVIQAVNANSSQIQTLSANSATLTTPGMTPTLRTSLAFQRSKRFRMMAEFLNSPEVDLGSNDEGFWFWIKRNETPGVFFCRHDQYATSPARRMIPLDPDFLIEALGLVELNPALPHQGPAQQGNRLEIRTIRETAQGPMTKVTVVDAFQAWILEQRLYDAQGTLVGSAVSAQHRQDPATGVWMPTVTNIACPSANFSMKIDLGRFTINRLQGDPAALWSVPSYPGSPLVNIGDPNFNPAALSAAPAAAPPQPRPAPGAYRGARAPTRQTRAW